MNLKRLRVQMMLRHPFFGSLMHNVKMCEKDTIPTACATNKLELWFNPSFMDTCSEDEQLFVMGHEILHVCFLHVFRIFEFADKQHIKVGNIAADYLVNFMLEEMKMIRPKVVQLYNPKYNPTDYTMEKLVKELLQNQPPQGKGKGKGTGIADGSDIEDQGGKEGEEQLTDQEKRDIERQVKSSLAAAVMQAKKRGDLPASIAKFCDEVLTPKTNWREELFDWFNIRIRSERSWHRPNRKMIGRGEYWPTKEAMGCGHIGIAVDMSGSIGQNELNIWAAELNHIFSSCRPTKVTVCYFDTRKEVREFDELPIKLEACLGGGTSFNVPFEHFNDLEEEPITGLVFMTDMYGTWPEEEPNYPLVVLSTTKKLSAPYGRTIYTKS